MDDIINVSDYIAHFDRDPDIHGSTHIQISFLISFSMLLLRPRCTSVILPCTRFSEIEKYIVLLNDAPFCT